MKRSKRIVLTATLLLASSLGSSALAADAALGKAQQLLGVLCKVSTLFGLPSTACDVEKALAQGVKVADSVKKTIDAFRKNTVPQAVQSALKSIGGGDSAQIDALRETISSTLATGDIDDLTTGVNTINAQIDTLFGNRAKAVSDRLNTAGSASAGASSKANDAAKFVSGNEATQGLALGSLAQEAQQAKQIVATAANGESAQRIAQGLTEDTTAVDLLTTAQKAAETSVQRAQTAVSSRAALQVIGEQIGFMMEQTASQHLHLTQVLAAQAQSSALTTQQLTTLASLELEKRRSEAAGASQDFIQLTTEAGQYATHIEETFKGWGQTLTASGTSVDLGTTAP
jgi:hypothetical protein